MRARVRIFEYFRTGEGEAPWNAEGCRLPDGLVIARGYPADPFILAVKVGTVWFDIRTVAHDDPGIQALRDSGHMVAIGPSPSQIEKERQKEEARQQQIDAQQAYQSDRTEFHLAQRRQAEEKHRRNVEQRRAEGR
ncbi:MAG TPA: hypothetical protein VM616_06335 [Gammaproteobacteria bacterium]|nr:hypothetical protein [Gammaproteobacteria bacterium]